MYSCTYKNTNAIKRLIRAYDETNQKFIEVEK